MELQNYLSDGANWQAVGVMAYLRSRTEYAMNTATHANVFSQLTIGRYENCREQGYIVSCKVNGGQRNWCFYEHRNTDRLCVVVFDCFSIDTPSKEKVWEVMKDKYDVTKDFECGEILECGQYILEDIKEFVDALLPKKTYLITLFNRSNPNETRIEEYEAITVSDAEEEAHRDWYERGWGVLKSREFSDEDEEE